jgi:hypothetical protein
MKICRKKTVSGEKKEGSEEALASFKRYLKHNVIEVRWTKRISLNNDFPA